MGRRGFGKVAMRNELARRDLEYNETYERAQAWEGVARSLARLIRDKKYAKYRKLSDAVLGFPEYSRKGPSGLFCSQTAVKKERTQ